MTFIPAVTGDADADDMALRVFLATAYDQSYPPDILGGGAPSLTNLFPSTVAYGATNTITVVGSGFTAQTVVHVGGVAVATTFVSETQVTFVWPGATHNSDAVVPVTAKNGSAVSTPLNMNVAPPNPTFTAIAPNSAVEGAGDVPVTITGAGFVARSRLMVEGVAQPTTLVSATSMTSVIPAASTAAAAILTCSLNTQPPVAGTGNSASNQTFTVTAAEQVASNYDPSAHTVAEVVAYAQAHPEEAQAILDAEQAGQNRVTLVSQLKQMLGQ